jgi:hypothetical protein
VFPEEAGVFRPLTTGLSALACTLVEALRRMALKGTEWAEAQVDTDPAQAVQNRRLKPCCDCYFG